MRVNREIGRIESSLGRAHRLGRILGVAFAAASVFFGILAVWLLVSLFLLGGPDGSALEIGAIYAFVEDLAMGSAFALCSLVAFDVSKGQTPFSQRQINRVLAMGWIMVGFTLFCLAWSPLVSVIDLSLGGAEYLIYPSEQAAGLDVNFEPLIAAGAFFLFAYILSYGKTLQELADEAL